MPSSASDRCLYIYFPLTEDKSTWATVDYPLIYANRSAIENIELLYQQVWSMPSSKRACTVCIVFPFLITYYSCLLLSYCQTHTIFIHETLKLLLDRASLSCIMILVFPVNFFNPYFILCYLFILYFKFNLYKINWYAINLIYIFL